MGFRYRKSVKVGPFKINFSKSGVGYSVGSKGFRVTKRADGRTQTTCSIPGTGISYVDVTGKPKKNYSITDYSNKTTNEITEFIFLFFITGGLYLYYAIFKFIKRKITKMR